MRKSLVLATLLLGLSAHAHAEQINLQQTAKPVPHNYPGVSLDILGISLGMSESAAEEVLKKEIGGDLNVTETSIGLRYNDVPMSTQKYVGGLQAQKLTDGMLVGLSPPTTGNVVVGAYRRVNYPDAEVAPQIAVVIEALEKKYGKPSRADIRAEPKVLVWMFDGTKSMPCTLRTCWHPVVDFDPSNVARYKTYVERDKELVVVEAIIHKHRKNDLRVENLEVSMEDRATKLISGTEALKQIEIAGQAAAKKAPPQVAPRL